MGRVGAGATLLMAVLAGCRAAPSSGAPSGRAEPSPGALGTSTTLGGAAVRVGDQTIAPSMVAGVARAQGLTPEAAARALVDEALLAEAAIQAGALRDPTVVRRIDAVRARTLVARERAAALAEGPVTDDEIAKAMGEEWIDLDSPATRTVVHALVPKGVPNGEALAGELRAQLLLAESAAGFLESAQAFGKAKGISVVAETIDMPFTIEGRIAQRGAGNTGLDAGFAAASFALAKPGDRSSVVATSFGWHVIELVEVRAEKRATRARKLEVLEPIIVKNRAYAAFEAKRAKLREAAHETTTATNADLGLPRAGPSPAPEPPR